MTARKRNGWIKIWRSLPESLDFPVEPFTYREAFQWLVMQAATQDAERCVVGRTQVFLMRGQVAFTYAELLEICRWKSKDKVHRFLKKMEQAGCLEILPAAQTERRQNADRTQSRTLATVVSICNYSAFQDKATDGRTVQFDGVQNPRAETAKNINEIKDLGLSKKGRKEETILPDSNYKTGAYARDDFHNYNFFDENVLHELAGEPLPEKQEATPPTPLAKPLEQLTPSKPMHLIDLARDRVLADRDREELQRCEEEQEPDWQAFCLAWEAYPAAKRNEHWKLAAYTEYRAALHAANATHEEFLTGVKNYAASRNASKQNYIYCKQFTGFCQQHHWKHWQQPEQPTGSGNAGQGVRQRSNSMDTVLRGGAKFIADMERMGNGRVKPDWRGSSQEP